MMTMRKMMVGLSLVAGIVSAAPILDETFDSSVGLLTGKNAAQFTNQVTWAQWAGTSDTVENAGRLKVTGIDGKTRGVFISLHESEFADEVTDYRLTLHWSMTLSEDSYLKTQIFEADIGSGGDNYYEIDSFANVGSGPTLSALGDAFKNQITNTVSVAGIVDNQEQVIEFSTAGTNDIAMVFAHMSTSANKGVLYLEDVRLEVIPEPATLGLVVATGTGILFIRRRIMM